MRDAPIVSRIVNVFEVERLGRPVLELENGSQFTLNDGNANTLIQAWGYDSDSWIGLEVELVARHLPGLENRSADAAGNREGARRLFASSTNAGAERRCAGGEQAAIAGEQGRDRRG